MLVVKQIMDLNLLASLTWPFEFMKFNPKSSRGMHDIYVIRFFFHHITLVVTITYDFNTLTLDLILELKFFYLCLGVFFFRLA